jgi:adenosine kinase
LSISVFQNKTVITLENVFEYTHNLIVTLGTEGSVIRNKNEEIQISIAKPNRVVDPTGCGDAYRAGLLFGLKKDFNLEKCGQIAATVASYVVEQHGTQNHEFKLDDFWEKYKINFGKEI